jgi:hypothetical protein
MRARQASPVAKNSLVAGDLVLLDLSIGEAMTNDDDETIKIAIAIGAIILVIWAIRMAIIALK